MFSGGGPIPSSSFRHLASIDRNVLYSPSVQQGIMRKRRQSMRNSADGDAASTETVPNPVIEQSQTLNLLNFVEAIKRENVESTTGGSSAPLQVVAIKQELGNEQQSTVSEQLQKPGLVCYLCLAAFDTRTVLAGHMGRVHRSKNIEEQSALSCPIELCNVVVFPNLNWLSMPDRIIPIRKEAADSKFMSYTRVFDDQDKFKKWRNRSLKSVSTMTCDQSNQTDQYLETIFHCRPSFAKENAACPAFSNIRLMKTGKIKITYCLDHLGHTIGDQDDSPDDNIIDDEALEVLPDELLNENSTDSTVGDVLRKRLRDGAPLETSTPTPTPTATAATTPITTPMTTLAAPTPLLAATPTILIAPAPSSDHLVTNRPITNSILPQQFTIRHGLFDDVLEKEEKKFTYRDFYDTIWDFFCFIRTQHETITCERLKMSALEIAKRMGLTLFTGNDWWLRSFKRRHKLRFSTMTGEPFDYETVKEVVLKCEAEDRTVEEVLAEAAEAERQAQKRSVATETSPIPSPGPSAFTAVPPTASVAHTDSKIPSAMFPIPELNQNGVPPVSLPSVDVWQALTNSCLVPQKRDDADLSWAFEVIRSRVLQRNINLLPQLANLQAALALSQAPPVQNPHVVTVLPVPVTSTVDINGSSNIVIVSQPETAAHTNSTSKCNVRNTNGDQKETMALRPKKRRIAGK